MTDSEFNAILAELASAGLQEYDQVDVKPRYDIVLSTCRRAVPGWP